MISLNLAKLSTAQDAYPEEQTFQWKHENNGLMFVIDSYQQGGSTLQLLKVVQGTQIRDQIDLEHLINDAQDLIKSMQRRGIEMKADQLPISAIVRCPLLAIRWQLPNQKIRRLQIRFQTNEDYDRVHTHLHHLGLYMMPPQSKDRGSIASSDQSRTSNQPSIPPSVRTENQRTGPSCPPSRLSEISSRPYTTVSAPTVVESQTQEAAHARPSSAFPSSNITFPNPLTPPVHFPRPHSASVVSPDQPISFPPRDQPVVTIEQHDVSAARPETALLYDRPDTAELPPRRELPFRRDSLPTSSGSDDNRPHSRPSTGIMGPPPLPTRVSDLRPSSALTLSLDGELPPLRQPTIVADTAKKTSAQRPHTPLPPSRGRSKPGQVPTIFEEQHSFTPVSSSPQSYPTPDATSPLATRPLSAISNDAQSRPGSASPGVFVSPPTSSSRHRTDRTAAPAFSRDAENALKAYAMQSDDERRAALNSFILKSLDDKNFLTLVEDMETNWVRLGLGTW